MAELESHIREAANQRVTAIEEFLDADVILFYGQIYLSIKLGKQFREFIEDLKKESPKRGKIAIVLNTPGGHAESVEKLVEIIRYHYNEVIFIIPDEAMSAGTIFALSGDAIYMDYTSSLGPIDPQVYNGKDWVPALGYLDQVEKMISKSAKGEITDAELLWLQQLDLAMLSRYEQAKNLTITLLKRWLVEYKFKDWKLHSTDPQKIGQPVSKEEKEKRAEEIATLLSDNKIWHSHGRKIGVKTLQTLLRLKIEDYSQIDDLRRIIRAYSDYVTDYIYTNEYQFFLHSRRHFYHT